VTKAPPAGVEAQGGPDRFHGVETLGRPVGPAEQFGKPEHIASPLQIMTEGPLGGAAFNNEFGRPNLLGYFREYEQSVGKGARDRRATTSPS
jgi:hypothetical protein